jgi:DNA-directed RNA polymerase III subunit RPC1
MHQSLAIVGRAESASIVGHVQNGKVAHHKSVRNLIISIYFQSDTPLLGMTSPDSNPKDLIRTRIFVPPVCICPSVVSEVKAGT